MVIPWRTPRAPSRAITLFLAAIRRQEARRPCTGFPPRVGRRTYDGAVVSHLPAVTIARESSPARPNPRSTERRPSRAVTHGFRRRVTIAFDVEPARPGP